MPVNHEILSRFMLEEEDMEYMVEIKVNGPSVMTRYELLLNLSFDVEDKYQFFGTPIIDTDNSSTRIIVVRPDDQRPRQ